MTAREFLNLQEAFLFAYAPIAVFLFGLLAGTGILSAISYLFISFTKWITSAER